MPLRARARSRGAAPPGALRPASVPGPGRTLFGNAVTVLPNGRAIFDAILAEIARARRTLAIEMYTWQDDRIGRRFADAVAGRARQGVACYVILDSFGSFTSGRLGAGLVDAGVHLVWYNPLNPRAPGAWSPNRRDHRKLVLVDGTAGFTGGMNLAEEYTEEFRGDLAWRDLAVRIEGPAVREMTRLFLSSWRHAGGSTRGMGPLIASPRDAGEAGVDVLGGRGMRSRRRLRRFHVAQIALARRSVFLAHAYFIPGRSLLRALRRAARRGVKVELLLPGMTDVLLVLWAGRATYGRLLSAGVRIREMNHAMLHAKLAVFDDEVLLTGSANLDVRSFRHNLELAVNVRDARAASDALAAYAPEFARSTELRLEDWRRRSVRSRLLERFARIFAYWL